MSYDPNQHHRRSIRMKRFDYTRAGAYFVTVCTQNREPILDDPIVAGIATAVWLALPEWFPYVGLDEFVIMPTHAHFVLWLSIHPEVGDSNGPRTDTVLTPPADPHIHIYNGELSHAAPQQPTDWILPAALTVNEHPRLGDVVGAWKSLTTTVYLEWIKCHGLVRRANFWQRNYYERIVRNDRALAAIRQYIRDNPKNWDKDPDNLANREQLSFPQTIDDYLDDLRRFVKRRS